MNPYDPGAIQLREIESFALRFNASELRSIRNAAQDALLAGKGEVVITSLGLGGTNGSGELTGKPRYLMALAQAALDLADGKGDRSSLASVVNFGVRRIET